MNSNYSYTHIMNRENQKPLLSAAEEEEARTEKEKIEHMAEEYIRLINSSAHSEKTKLKWIERLDTLILELRKARYEKNEKREEEALISLRGLRLLIIATPAEVEIDAREKTPTDRITADRVHAIRKKIMDALVGYTNWCDKTPESKKKALIQTAIDDLQGFEKGLDNMSNVNKEKELAELDEWLNTILIKLKEKDLL